MSSSTGWRVALTATWVAASPWWAGCEASSASPTEEPLVECVVEGRIEACFTGPSEQRHLGMCRDGTRECQSGAWTECTGEVLAALTETCGDGLDDDCDGAPDNGCACTTFDSQSCFGALPEYRDVGACVSGQQQCVGGSWSVECAGQVLPSEAEICGNALDDDCNGGVDDDCEGSDAGTG